MQKNLDGPWITDIYFAVYPHFFDEEECEAEIEDGCKKRLADPVKTEELEVKPEDIPVDVKLNLPLW